jgi:ABC-type branched-subunit amino acid transport system substrate-binding protein
MDKPVVAPPLVEPVPHAERMRLGIILAPMLAAAWPARVARAAGEPIVLGQSLPLSGPGFPIANRVSMGAKAVAERVNAAGGIHGRPLEIISLDDGGNPKRLAGNVRSLVERDNALAIVNCLGEQASIEAAQATRKLGVPLIGPMSGAAELRELNVGHVFTLRPSDARESAALANQLKSIGVTRTVLLADDTQPRRNDALATSLRQAGMRITRLSADKRPESLDAALSAIGEGQPQALVLNLGEVMLDALGRLPTSKREGVPAIIATLSSSGLTQVTRMFRDRVVGFTSVVPNPELAHLQIARQLQSDAEEFVGPEAVSFEGMEAYMTLRLCVEALRLAGNRPTPHRLAESIEKLGNIDLGGVRLAFSGERHHGSDFVEIGMRARDGRTLR